MKTSTTNTGRRQTTQPELKNVFVNSKVQKLLFAVGCTILYMQLFSRQSTQAFQKCVKPYTRKKESEYGKMFRELKEHNLAVLEEHYGERCKTKDYEDFPDLLPLFAVGDPDSGRCPVCLVYEKFDAYWEALYYDDHDDYLEVS